MGMKIANDMIPISQVEPGTESGDFCGASEYPQRGFNCKSSEGQRVCSVTPSTIQEQSSGKKRQLESDWTYQCADLTYDKIMRSEHPPALPPIAVVKRFRFKEVPLANPVELELVSNDPPGFINFLGDLKEVRFYGEAAILMMDWDDPRDVSFLPGVRSVIIDEKDAIDLSFGSQGVIYMFADGFAAWIRLCAPTRPLVINGAFVQAKFGGPPVDVLLGGSRRKIQLGGPNPQVSVGTAKRTELVAGRVKLIVDEDLNNIFHIYLDPKPQRFYIRNTPMILKFADSLETVLINGTPFKMDFGGRAVSLKVRDEIHRIRLSALPEGLIPGHVYIKNMECTSSGSYSYRQMENIITDPIKGLLSRMETISNECIDVKLLFKLLMEKGMIQPKEESIDFSAEFLKKRNSSLVREMYKGAQCPICSLRFLRRGNFYTSHIDWHFQFRLHSTGHKPKWWCHASEFPRSEQNTSFEFDWFERNKQTKIAEPEEEPSVSARSYGPGPKCFACLESFTQFYNEEKEEWQLKNAISHQGVLYHPICKGDVDKSSTSETIEKKNENSSLDEAIKIPSDQFRMYPSSDNNLEQHNGNKNTFNVSSEELMPSSQMIYFNVDDGPHAFTAENKSLQFDNSKFNDMDLIEMVELKPYTETIDLSEEGLEDRCLNECGTPHQNEEVKIRQMAEGRIQTFHTGQCSIQIATTLDGNAQNGPFPVIKNTPIKVNISSNSLVKNKDWAVVKGSVSKDNLETNEEEFIDPANMKPKFVKRKIAETNMIVMPTKRRGKDDSALCSIM